MGNYIVYMHISPSNKKYIGITGQDVKNRWSNGKGYKSNKYFYRAIEKYGWDNFKHIIIARGLSEEEAKWIEIELIREWDSTNKDKGYNITLGGEGTNGWHPSEETRKKISENNAKYWLDKTLSEETRKKISETRIKKGIGKGENHPNYGKHLSEETRKKISEAHKGQVVSEATKEKLREANKGENNGFYGKKHTEEAKRKISNATKGRESWNKGKTLSEETRKKISEANKGNNNAPTKSIICITTMRIFNSLADASRYYDTSCQNICKCCKGKIKSSGKLPNGSKLVWRYIEIIEL